MSSDRSGEFDGFPWGRLGWWIVVSALLCLGATRASGAWYSYGLDGYADEPEVVDPALRAAKGDLRPERFLYPGWTSYTIGATYKVLDVFGYGGEAGFLTPEPTPDHFVVARLVVFATALASALVAALVARRLFGPWAGVAACALLLVSPEFTSMSYVVQVNTPASLWTALAILFSARIYLDGRRARDYVLAGICAGFAVGCKYNSYPAALPILIAHAFAPRADGRWRHGWFVFAGALVPLAFALTTPYAFLDFERFLESVRFLNSVYQDQHWPLHTSASSGSWLNYLDRIWRSGWPFELSVAALAGLWFACVSDWRRPALVLSAALANLLFLGFYKVYFLRHLLPAIPPLAMLSGAFVQRVVDGVDRERARRKLATAAATALVLLLGFRAFEETQGKLAGKTKVDSRQAALEWIERNIPKGARIACEERAPKLEGYELVQARSIAAPTDRTAEIEAQADWVVVTLMSERLIERDPAWSGAREVYAKFADRHELAAEFLGRGVDYAGRDIRIFRVRR
jgi:hypothetical protein